MNAKSQQLLPDCTLVEDWDQRISKSKINELLANLFGDKIDFIKCLGKRLPVINGDTVLLCSQITYLGNPHPVYKKRIQLKKWYFDCYKELSKKYKIYFIGVYFYKENLIFCEFDKKLYLKNKMHNSSAHIYINDLYQAMKNESFVKYDKNKNVIRVFTPDLFKKFVLNFFDKIKYDDLLSVINQFNVSFDFGKQIWAIDAIKEMHEANFKKWKETEWPGWFLEYKFDDFTKANSLTHLVKYINNQKKDDLLDFDIMFPTHNFYGDLKASSLNALSTMLNDAQNIGYELSKFKKLWYIVYEHETVKDRDLNGFPMTKARLNYIRQFDQNYCLGRDLSYSSRMKAAVTYKKMFVVEINEINYMTLLEKMTSNFHQPDKITKRNPKFKLTKSNIENAIIYRYSI